MTPGENVLLITGFCGGFTTFSSFADDMWVLGSKVTGAHLQPILWPQSWSASSLCGPDWPSSA